MQEKILFIGVLAALLVVHVNPSIKKQTGVVLASLLFLSYVASSMNASGSSLSKSSTKSRVSAANPVYYYENAGYGDEMVAEVDEFVDPVFRGEEEGDGPLQDVVGLRAPPPRFSVPPSQVDFYKDQLGAPEDRGKGLPLTRGYSGYIPTQFTSEPEMAW